MSAPSPARAAPRARDHPRLRASAAVADALEDAVAIPYAELPGFPAAERRRPRRHAVLGTLGGLPVACLQGRKHIYEGGDPRRDARRRSARCKAAGAEALLRHQRGRLAARGGRPGPLMAIADHINLLGVNPLTGPNDDAIGPRFPSLRDAYDPELRALLQHRRDGARRSPLAEGVYLATPGPSFETPAEIRAFRTLGADAVGMSTVPEVILARHCRPARRRGLGDHQPRRGHGRRGALARADARATPTWRRGDLTRLIPRSARSWLDDARR